MEAGVRESPRGDLTVGDTQPESDAGRQLGDALQDAAIGVARDGVATGQDLEGAQGLEVRAVRGEQRARLLEPELDRGREPVATAVQPVHHPLRALRKAAGQPLAEVGEVAEHLDAVGGRRFGGR